MRKITLLLITFAFVWPGSASAVDELGSFSSSSLTMAGSGEAIGRLTGFRLGTTPEAYPLPEAAGLFTVDAERLDIRIIHERFDRTDSVTAPRGEVTTSDHPYGQSKIRFAAPRETFSLIVVPIAGAAPATLGATFATASFTPSDVAKVEARLEATKEPAPGFTSDTSKSVTLRLDEDSNSLRIQGSFRISLYNWNFTVDDLAAGKKDEHFTGEKSDTVVPPIATWGGIRQNVERRQALVTVTNGSLAFRLPSANEGLLLAEGVSLSGAGTWTLDDVSGVLADGRGLRETAAPQVLLRGDLTASAAKLDADRLQSSWAGRPDRVDVGGDTVEWAAPLAAPSVAANTLGSYWWGWAGALVAAVAVGLAGRTWHIGRERSRMRTLELLSRIRDDERAVKVAETLLKSPSFRFDAAILKTEALVRQGRLQEAGRFVKEDCGWMDPASGVREFLQALVAAHEGDRETAALFLGRALATAPEYRTEVLRTPVFHLVRTDPRVARFLRGGAPAAPLPDGYS